MAFHDSQHHRARSPSRTRHPYTPNCGRRRWPPSPKVEDELASLLEEYPPKPLRLRDDEVQMRGELEQTPCIIDVKERPTSSDWSVSSDSSTLMTPPVTPNDNGDRRYVWKPEDGIQIPLTYGKSKDAKIAHQGNVSDSRNKERGRTTAPKLDTNVAQTRSDGGPLPHLERERSPYGSGPRPPKPKENRFSHEYLLSPEPVSPRVRFEENQRPKPHHPPRPLFVDSSRTSYQSRQAHEQSAHPIMGDSRRSSDQSQQDQPPSARPSLGDSRRTSDHYQHDNVQTMRPRTEDHRKYSYHIKYEDRQPASRVPDDSHRTSGYNNQNHTQPVRPSPTPFGRHASTSEYVPQDPQRPMRPPMAPLGRHASAVAYPGAPMSPGPLTPHSKFHGGSSDESDFSYDESGRRQAKPRMLPPKDQPKSSVPHSAEVHRPSVERHISKNPPASVAAVDPRVPAMDRASLFSSESLLKLTARLENNSNGGRKASPRSSPTSSTYPSPPKTPPSETHQHRANPVSSLKNDSPRSRPPSPLSSSSSSSVAWSGQMPADTDRGGRRRPPLPKSRRTSPLPLPRSEEPLRTSGPDFELRQASPAVRHGKSLSIEAIEPQQSTGRQRSDTQKLSTLQPPGFSGRRRSSTHGDAERPQLTVKTPSFLQPFSSQPSPSSKSRPSSPNPPSLDQRSRSAVPETPSSTRRARSRSYVPPEYAAAAAASAASVTSPTIARPSVSVTTQPITRSASSVQISAPPVQAQARTQPAQLGICPRPDPVAGLHDWYTLNRKTSFTICPDCLHNNFSAGYAHCFKPLAPEEHDYKIQCDLNDPWMRIATLIILQERRPDIDLLCDLAKVATKERSCPTNNVATRDWFHLEDISNGKHIPNFNVCPHCVRCIKALFPVLEDVFYQPRSHHHEDKQRVCALRSDGVRFVQYIDVLGKSASEARLLRREPNIAPISRLAKQYARMSDSHNEKEPPLDSPKQHSLPECPKDAMLPRKSWHIHPHIPEFTVCPACYEEVVRPAVRNSPLAARFDRKPQLMAQPEVEVNCNLYSARMRKVFQEACEDDDFDHLKHQAHRRHILQMDLFDAIADQRRHPKDDDALENMTYLWQEWKKKE